MAWAVPKFGYGDRVLVLACDKVNARVIDLHFLGQYGMVEYDVRWFQDGKEVRARVFEDELIEDPTGDVRAHDGMIYKVKTP
jgi:hypothetical protein